MAHNLNSLLVLCFHVFLVLSLTDARPFNVLGSPDCFKGLDGFFNGLSIMGIKNSGPSPGGEGHNYVNAQTLGGIKNSVPSPGAGHAYKNAQTLAGIKVSGPSPGGKGHSFTNAQTLGGIKGHDGHKVFDIRIFGGMKDSGPSPGQGHRYVVGAHQ